MFPSLQQQQQLGVLLQQSAAAAAAAFVAVFCWRRLDPNWCVDGVLAPPPITHYTLAITTTPGTHYHTHTPVWFSCVTTTPLGYREAPHAPPPPPPTLVAHNALPESSNAHSSPLSEPKWEGFPQGQDHNSGCQNNGYYLVGLYSSVNYAIMITHLVLMKGSPEIILGYLHYDILKLITDS